MAFVRIITERLFLLLFSLLRAAFFAQGLAVCAALIAVRMSAPTYTPDWLQAGLRSCLLVGASFLVTAGLMIAARGVTSRPAVATAGPGWPWPGLLVLCLFCCPLLVRDGASALLDLWWMVAGLLDSIGFWEGISRPDPYGGIVLLPIFFALFVPLLESATALGLIVVPLGMVVLVLTRSRLFPTVFAMAAACLAGLAIGGLLAADAWSRLAGEAIALMSEAEDVEVDQVAEMLGSFEAVLTSVARSFVVPVLICLAWLPFVLRSPRVAAFFTEPAPPAP